MFRSDNTAGLVPSCRLFEGMQLDPWTRLGGLTGLTLQEVAVGHRGTLVAVLPRLTALQALVLDDDGVSGLSAASVQQSGGQHAACLLV